MLLFWKSMIWFTCPSSSLSLSETSMVPMLIFPWDAGGWLTGAWVLVLNSSLNQSPKGIELKLSDSLSRALSHKKLLSQVILATDNMITSCPIKYWVPPEGLVLEPQHQHHLLHPGDHSIVFLIMPVSLLKMMKAPLPPPRKSWPWQGPRHSQQTPDRTGHARRRNQLCSETIVWIQASSFINHSSLLELEVMKQSQLGTGQWTNFGIGITWNCASFSSLSAIFSFLLTSL